MSSSQMCRASPSKKGRFESDPKFRTLRDHMNATSYHRYLNDYNAFSEAAIMVREALVEAINGGKSFDDASDLVERFIPKFVCLDLDDTMGDIANPATFKKGTFDGVETFYIPVLEKYMIVLEESLDVNDKNVEAALKRGLVKGRRAVFDCCVAVNVDPFSSTTTPSLLGKHLPAEGGEGFKLQIGEAYVLDSDPTVTYQCFDEEGDVVLEEQLECLTLGIREKGEEDSSDEQDDGN